MRNGKGTGTEKNDRKTEYFGLFVCLEPHEQFVSYLAAVTITSDRAVARNANCLIVLNYLPCQ
jgi:hypothetical protein